MPGASTFGYQLLWVLVLSNLMAILLQALGARPADCNVMPLTQSW
jgi:Mn2+/Fe2+ NRAMP family transporter